MKKDREAAEADPLVAIAGGGGVTLCNSMGNAWTADYLKVTGELDVDLRSNIAAEARAKIVYERLINFCDDPGTKDALQFLMTREITHMKAFMAALDSMGKDPLSIGKIPPTPGIVDEFYNDSTGEGDDGEIDARGPWNQGDDWKFVEAPALDDGVKASARKSQGSANSGGAKKRTSNDARLMNTLDKDYAAGLLDHCDPPCLLALPADSSAPSGQSAGSDPVREPREGAGGVAPATILEGRDTAIAGTVPGIG
jgi:Mn-containing catalase